jgi:hypothetical protein
MLMVFYVVASCGLVLPLLLLARILADPIAELDEAGFVTRKGRRFLWRDVRGTETKVEFSRRSRPSSMPTNWRVEFEFDEGKVAFTPAPYENGLDALAFIEKALGKPLGRPRPRREMPPTPPTSPTQP